MDGVIAVRSLWLPILLSAVIVWVASSIIHLVLTYHRSDYAKLPGEANIAEAMRKEGVAPGGYIIPYAGSPKAMGTPEMVEKYKKGPVALIRVWPSGVPTMGRSLTLWFLFCLAVGVFTAYIAGRTLGAGATYREVFRIAGTVAFLGYAGAEPLNAIFKGQPWPATIKHMFDGLVYALLSAGVFGWLWPNTV
jgi:hypothetical protein